MATLATYVGVTPRTVILGNAAVGRGKRVTQDSNGVFLASAIGVRGDFVLLNDGGANEATPGASMQDGGKVPAFATEAVAVDDPAYSAASGGFSKTSTNAVLVGKWTTATDANTLGEVELHNPA